MLYEALFIVVLILAPVALGCAVCDCIQARSKRRRNLIPAYFK